MEKYNEYLEEIKRTKELEVSKEALDNLRLKKIQTGEILSKKNGIPSLDKPWLALYSDEKIITKQPNMTAYQYMKESNKKHMNDIAIEYLGVKITYRELLNRIDEVAAAFLSYGIKKGDIVAISCTNTPEVIYIFYALSKIGAVVDISDPLINENVMSNYLKDTNAKIFMCLDLTISKHYEMLKNAGVEQIVTLPVLQSLPAPLKAYAKAKQFIDSKTKGTPLPKIVEFPQDDLRYYSYSEFIKHGKNTKIVEEPYEKDRAVAIIHTGGSTGTPKGATLSNDNLNSAVHQLRLSDLEFQYKRRWLNLMPPCVAYGLGNGIHLALSSGMTTILIPTYEPAKFVEQLKKYKPNGLAGSPAHWEYFARSEKVKELDLSNLHNPIQGGDSLNTELENKINELLKQQGCKDQLRKGYGLSETCAALCVANTTVDNSLLLDSVGYPLINTTIGIFEPGTQQELSYNEVGEVCACSNNVMLGYYNRPEENAQTIQIHPDGKRWIHTGDLGIITEDGRVFIKGRIKKLIIKNTGAKIYANDIERIIASHPAVALVSVVGIKDSDHDIGELPKAYIVLKNEYKGNSDIIDDIKKLCEEKLVYYMYPVAYEELEDMPYTNVGKIDFMKLKSYQPETKMESGYTRVRRK